MNDFDSIIKRMTVTRLEPGDYTGEGRLLYCGKYRTPKQFRIEAPPLEARRHRQAVADLKRRGFTDPAMRKRTFANDNGKCPQMKHARFYVERWETMQEENIGYGKQTSQCYRWHDLPPAQAGHPALYGEENRQDHLPCVGAFQ